MLQIEKYPFETLRTFLIIHTFAYRRIVKDVKTKYELDKMTPSEIKGKLILEDFLNSPIHKELKVIEKLTGVNVSIIERTFYEDLAIDQIQNQWQGIYISDATSPLPEGFYIRVTPETTLSSLKSDFEKVKKEHKFLKESSAGKDYPVLREKERYPKDLTRKIKCFLVVEENLEKIVTTEQVTDSAVTKAVADASLDKRIVTLFPEGNEDIDQYVDQAYRSLQRVFNILPYTKLVLIRS